LAAPLAPRAAILNPSNSAASGTKEHRGKAARQGITMDQRKIFWGVFILLGLIADFAFPLLWAVLATIPIAVISWWVAYRSDWF
jgi:hypothetical protein